MPARTDAVPVFGNAAHWAADLPPERAASPAQPRVNHSHQAGRPGQETFSLHIDAAGQHLEHPRMPACHSPGPGRPSPRQRVGACERRPGEAERQEPHHRATGVFTPGPAQWPRSPAAAPTARPATHAVRTASENARMCARSRPARSGRRATFRMYGSAPLRPFLCWRVDTIRSEWNAHYRDADLFSRSTGSSSARRSASPLQRNHAPLSARAGPSPAVPASTDSSYAQTPRREEFTA